MANGKIMGRQQAHLVIVLGMHRGGTSLVTRALGVLGIDLGNNLMPGAADNTKGFWEDLDVVAVNEAVLQALGSRWDSLAPIRHEELMSLGLSDLALRATEILQAKLAPCGLFAMKDPRTARLLPFWHMIGDRLGVRVSHVIVGRHPLSVVHSLSRRQDFDSTKGHLLWLESMVGALHWTQGMARVVVDYDRMIENPQRELARLAAALDLPFPADRPDVPHFCHEFVEAQLRHTRFLPNDLLLDASAPPLVSDLYRSLLALAVDQPHSDLDQVLVRAKDWLHQSHSLLSRMQAADMTGLRQMAALAQSQEQMAETQCQLLKREEHLVQLEADLAERNKMIAQHQVDLSKMAEIQAATSTRMDDLAQRLRQVEEAQISIAAIATSLHGVLSFRQRWGGLLRSALRGRLFMRLAEDRDIAIIARSGLFDAAYYLRRYPDVATAGLDPIVHYVRCGARESRDPHPWFDTRFYWESYPDLRRSGINPLAHYARFGAQEGRLTNGFGQPADTVSKDLSLLLSTRIFGRAEASSADRPSQSMTLPAEAFPWLPQGQGLELSLLLHQYGLTETRTGKAPWDGAAEAAARIAAAYARLPDGPPEISILIPVHNQIRHTLAALEALGRWPSRRSFEILVGDDASTDGTFEILAAIPRVRVVRNEQAEGFVDNCNRTSAQARGRFIVLLNNDTVILPGSLDALIDTFADHSECGLVGCRLLYPDGRLQEAGGIVWADGSAWNHGRLDNATLSAYTYVREVDYCSGAALALPTELWRSLGGFDTRYRPAYYEDTDLAFRVREADLKVLYQPKAAVIHFEGVSNGTSEETGLKRYQRENLPKFLARWKTVLTANGMPDAGRPWNYAERSRKGRVLVLDTTVPTPDRDSGSMDTIHMLRILRRQGWHVTFMPENLLDDGQHMASVRRMGVECLCRPTVTDFQATVIKMAGEFQVIIVSRQPLARQMMGRLRTAAPKARLIFNTVDLHFVREEREAELYGDPAMARRAKDTRQSELASIRSADVTLVVSSFEAKLLAELAPTSSVRVMPLRREIPPGPFPGFAEREGVLFVGGFRHPPNQDAVRWLLNDIWPLVRRAGLQIPLYIAGADAPPFLIDDPANGVHVLGHVPDLAALFGRVRVSVAPLRYGAGVKGKVIDSLCHAVPVVVTGIAGEGAELEAGRNVMLGETAEDLARAIIQLYGDEALWHRLSTEGRSAVGHRFSVEWSDRVLRGLLSELGFTWCMEEAEPC